jgi:hypothetical protein
LMHNYIYFETLEVGRGFARFDSVRQGAARVRARELSAQGFAFQFQDRHLC